MSKLQVAMRLADELGTSVGKARTFVDDVGLDAARGAVDDVAQKGSQTVSNWWRPTVIGGGLAGGGALAWRQQDIAQARQIANQQRSYKSAMQSILESDLPPDAKREMVRNLQNSGNGGNGDGGDDSGWSLPWSGDGGGGPFGDLQMLLALVIVAVLVLQYADGGE